MRQQWTTQTTVGVRMLGRALVCPQVFHIRNCSEDIAELSLRVCLTITCQLVAASLHDISGISRCQITAWSPLGCLHPDTRHCTLAETLRNNTVNTDVFLGRMSFCVWTQPLSASSLGVSAWYHWQHQFMYRHVSMTAHLPVSCHITNCEIRNKRGAWGLLHTVSWGQEGLK